mgnify:CR=1 FL=1
MAESYSRILVHIVFGTKYRKKTIPENLHFRLYAYMRQTCIIKDCAPLAINGTSDHVHVFCSLGRSIPVARLVQSIKSASSKWIQKNSGNSDFKWQRGYGAFSVSYYEPEKVISYIINQKTHHRCRSFRDELIDLFYQCGVEFRDEYLD